MQRALGFEASYRRHLATEQRRAVLDALARSFDPDATVGEIVDAAAALGWVDLGDLSLADLADALLTDRVSAPSGGAAATDGAAASDDDEDDEEEDVDEDDEVEDDEEEPVPPARGGRRTVAVPTKAAASKPAAKAAPSKAAPTPPPKPAKGAKPGKPTKVSLDDRMSLDEAAAVLLPLVRQHGEATMQQLEQSTAGAGRRKLRFHIGQLVKNGRLERHGMGRGTFYTVA